MPWVVAIFLNGSTVVGTDQPDSDIDFTVIVREDRDRLRALRLLRRHFRFLGLDHGVPTFAGQRRLGITLLDRRAAARLLSRLYRSPQDLLAVQGTVQHKFVEAVAIFDPNGLLVKYQARAAAYPERIRTAVFRTSMRSLEEAHEAWGSRNEFHFAYALPSVLESVCLALYARNRRLFMPAFKRLHKDLQELKPDLEDEVYRLVRGGRHAESRRAARKDLRRIIVKLTKGM
jgi:hypothetical protein